MLDNYMDNFENIVSSTLFITFIATIIALTSILILSLIMLAIGCLIKSQKLKTKFLTTVPKILLGIMFVLMLPIIFAYLKNLV